MKEKILSNIKTKKMGKSVYYFQCTDSTNVQAKRLAEEGAVHGSVVVADEQTAGRGRRGRSWDSPAGKNLYFTLLLKPDFAPDKASMLTLVMALAVKKGLDRVFGQLLMQKECQDYVQETPRSGIKWPNDLVINGRKICGILTEMVLEQSSIKNVIIGVGINLEKQDFATELVDKATSIEAECGQKLCKAELLAEIMLAFEEYYETFIKTCDLTGLQEAYNVCLVNRDREVCVLDPKGEFHGIARGINSAGELWVEKEDGTVTEVYAGEVSVRGIYGYV